MTMSSDAREIVDAIKGNTRELKKLREAFERLAKVKPVNVTQIFSGGEEGSDTSTIDGPNGPIAPR